MDKSIVEQCREYYPMTFYPDSLSEILFLVNRVREQKDPIFHLEPIPLIIKQIHYYDEIGLKQFYCGCSTVFLLLLATVNTLLSNKITALILLLLTAIAFLCYCSLQIYKNNLRKRSRQIDKGFKHKRHYFSRHRNIFIKPSIG